MYLYNTRSIDRLIDWRTDRSIDRSIDWSSIRKNMNRIIVLLVYCLIDPLLQLQCMICLLYWCTVCLIDNYNCHRQNTAVSFCKHAAWNRDSWADQARTNLSTERDPKARHNHWAATSIVTALGCAFDRATRFRSKLKLLGIEHVFRNSFVQAYSDTRKCLRRVHWNRRAQACIKS